MEYIVKVTADEKTVGTSGQNVEIQIKDVGIIEVTKGHIYVEIDGIGVVYDGSIPTFAD
jgi:hypothetical protein